MLGYLLNNRTGATIYNLGHILFIPLALFALGHHTHQQLLSAVSLIWFSHIAFDRMLGYGLKYPVRFKDTHLQHVP